MRIPIQPDSAVPLYRQVADGMRAAIAGGLLQPGQPAPSVRALAAEIGVNYHTVARAWRELEAAGLLERQRGGAFLVAADAEHRSQDQELRQQAQALCRQALASGLDATAIHDLVQDCLDELEELCSA